MPPPTTGGRSKTNIPLAKMFNEAFEKKYGYKPEWGAENAYISFAHLGPHGRGSRQLLSA